MSNDEKAFYGYVYTRCFFPVCVLVHSMCSCFYTGCSCLQYAFLFILAALVYIRCCCLYAGSRALRLLRARPLAQEVVQATSSLKTPMTTCTVKQHATFSIDWHVTTRSYRSYSDDARTANIQTFVHVNSCYMFGSGWPVNDIGCRTLLRWRERIDYALHFVAERTVCFSLIHVVKVKKIIIIRLSWFFDGRCSCLVRLDMFIQY